MEIIISNRKDLKSDKIFKFGSTSLEFKKNENQQNPREIFIETKDLLIIGTANKSFVDEVNEISITNITSYICKLTNGFIVIVDKRDDKITIYNDIYGFTPLYLIQTNQNFIIGNNYSQLVKISSQKLNSYAVLDLLLFNYTLLNRTLLRDIQRFEPGSVTTIKSGKVESRLLNGFVENFKWSNKKEKFSVPKFTNLLKLVISEELFSDLTNTLTITAGFDSRALLAACNNLKISLSTLTFGQDGNIEQETVKTFIHNFSRNFSFVKFDQTYVENIEDYYKSFIIKTLDNPVVQDLIQYEYINRTIKPTNLIVGFMGGEFMSGQSVGAQVTFTQSAKDLLVAKTTEEVYEKFKAVLLEMDFVSPDFYENILFEYAKTLEIYFKKGNHKNVLRFLIYEKFVKFFGTVNTVVNNANVVIPFMHPQFLNYLLQTELSILHKGPFATSPFRNFTSKRLYAKSITQLDKRLSNTKLDRLYEIRDLAMLSRFPYVLYGLLQSRLFKKNKNKYPRPHDYANWFSLLNCRAINNIRNNIVVEDFKLDIKQYNEKELIYKRKIMNIAAVLYSFLEMSKIK